MPWTKTDRAVMADVYKLLQENADPTEDQAWWDGLIRQACDIVSRNEQNPLAVEMCTGALIYLEKKWEQNRRDG